jgi:CHAT domain-containing protein
VKYAFMQAHQAEFSVRAGIQGERLNNVGLALHGLGRDPASERIVTAANDGILTGAEVARLMLAGTELVVMSACDTAIGEDAGA